MLLQCVTLKIVAANRLEANSPLKKKKEGNWVELTFAKTSGTVPRDRRKNWPLADRRVASNDPRNTRGIHFGSIFHLVSKVATWCR